MFVLFSKYIHICVKLT